MRLTTATAALAIVSWCWLAGAAPALASVSETQLHVTSPAGTYLTFDEVTGAETIKVDGSSNGSPGEKLDLNCYSGGGWETLAQDVFIEPGGGFSYEGSFRPITDQTCVLRAVPHADTKDLPPGSPSAFAGPTLALGLRRNDTVAKGPNSGALTSYYLYDSQLLGAFDYGSLGDCSILDSYTYDPLNFGTFATAPRLDDCDAGFWWENGASGITGIALPTRSELQVDGADAYLPGNAPSLFTGAENDPGLPVLIYGYEVEPATGDLTIDETDPIVTCAPSPLAYPPTSSTCSSFVPSGVQVETVISQTQSGRVASVTQWFYSVDGLPHQIDLLEENQFFHLHKDGELDLPWTGEGFTKYGTAGAELPGAPAAPGSFFIKGSASVPDGSEESAQGAVTFSNAPEGETVVGATTNEFSWVNLHYRRTVPASGAVPLGFSYSNAFLLREVEGYAAAAQAAYLPTVAIDAPAQGASVSQPQATVTGTATDQTGLSSLIVNGESIPVVNGSWSTTVPLNLGPNTITATATNVFGHSARAAISVTYALPSAPPSSAIGAATRKPSVGGLTASPHGVGFTVSCQAPPAQRCDGVAVLSSTERSRDKHVLAISARTKRKGRHPPARLVTVTVGRLTFALAAGQTQTFFVALNKVGLGLLARFHELPATLAVTLASAGAAPPLISRSSLKIRPAKKRHHEKPAHPAHQRRKRG
jgi:Glucodextranase, domain B